MWIFNLPINSNRCRFCPHPVNKTLKMISTPKMYKLIVKPKEGPTENHNGLDHGDRRLWVPQPDPGRAAPNRSSAVGTVGVCVTPVGEHHRGGKARDLGGSAHP